MRTIQLTKGQQTFVNDEDYEYLSQWKWCAAYNKKTGSYYARRGFWNAGRTHPISMHRVILELVNSKQLVDHKDHNTLNNQRSNLRIVDYSQNNMNRVAKKKGSSKYLGVCKMTHTTKNKLKDGSISPSHGIKWISSIRYQGKNYSLGCFPYTPEGELEAAKAYDIKAKELFGVYANPNFKD
jgi:hypothetical protein